MGSVIGGIWPGFGTLTSGTFAACVDVSVRVEVVVLVELLPQPAINPAASKAAQAGARGRLIGSP